jgi:hypothetical protein
MHVMGFEAQDAEGGPKPQMFKLRINLQGLEAPPSC